MDELIAPESESKCGFIFCFFIAPLPCIERLTLKVLRTWTLETESLDLNPNSTIMPTFLRLRASVHSFIKWKILIILTVGSYWALLVAQMIENPPSMWETPGSEISPG